MAGLEAERSAPDKAAHAASISRAPRISRILLVALGVVLLLALIVLGTVGWIGSERAIHPTVRTYAWRLSQYPNLHAQSVALTSQTGITIAGRFFPGRSRATIILSHGYGDNQDQMIPWADFLNRAGYTVFTYDMRDRGRSGGTAVTLGALEQKDLVSVVGYVASRPDVDRARIGALGVSLGGATTILAAAADHRIKVVVDDCGFSDAPRVIDSAFEHFIGLPAFPFSPIAVKIAELRAGIDLNAVRPVDVVGSISPRPILIIHGLADQLVPPANSQRIYAAAGQPKKLWLVAGAGHNGSRTVAGAAYVHRVVAFFNRYL